jgi:hypothetical protein
MTLFTQIYDEPHDFQDGNVAIANTLSNLSKAYIECLVTGLSDSLATPMLLGFLYQIDVNAKRSKPYPIISQRQTINLDLSECESFLFLPSNRLIDEYVLKLYLSAESGNGGTIDLSGYALISQLPSLSDYVTNSALFLALDTYVNDSDLLTVLDGYISNSELEMSLQNYALTSQLPSLANYVTSSSLSTLLADYALTANLPIAGSAQNFIPLTANRTLESNKNYISTVLGLTFTLPLSPEIGDVINASTRDFNATILQNTSQTILNLSTQTPAGSGTGLILKPYSSIQLIFVGNGLWVTGYRTRTINNWLPFSESIQSLAYTPIDTGNLSLSPPPSWGTLPVINNNLFADGNTTSSINIGSIDNTGRFLRIDFATPVELSSVDFYFGWGNRSIGENRSEVPQQVRLYGGTTSNLLGTLADIPDTTGIKRTLTPSRFNATFATYFVQIFNTRSTNCGLVELDTFGYAVTGGETVAI